jgi:hypothetical protein
MENLGEKKSGKTEQLLADQQVNEAGEESFEVRLDLQYEDARGVLADWWLASVQSQKIGLVLSQIFQLPTTLRLDSLYESSART